MALLVYDVDAADAVYLMPYFHYENVQKNCWFKNFSFSFGKHFKIDKDSIAQLHKINIISFITHLAICRFHLAHQ